jgi:hypothetical protein
MSGTEGELLEIGTVELLNVVDIDQLIHSCVKDGVHISSIFKLLLMNFLRLRKLPIRFLSASYVAYLDTKLRERVQSG